MFGFQNKLLGLELNRKWEMGWRKRTGGKMERIYIKNVELHKILYFDTFSIFLFRDVWKKINS